MDKDVIGKILRQFNIEEPALKIYLIFKNNMFLASIRDYQRARRFIGRGSLNKEAKLMFYTHQLEKGLSHRDFRYGFGTKVINGMSPIMNKASDDLKKSLTYTNALSALNRYFEVHEKNNFDISDKKNALGPKIVKEITACNSKTGGDKSLSYESKINNKSKNFKKLFNERYSVRDYSSKPVPQKKVTFRSQKYHKNSFSM